MSSNAEGSRKRDAPSQDARGSYANKKQKIWQQKKGARGGASIEPGDTGIFATCARHREANCVSELKSLLEEFTEDLHSDSKDKDATNDDDDDAGDLDVEAEIKAEVQGMQDRKAKQTFTNVMLDIECVVFIKTAPPIQPVSLVRKICEDALATGKARTRFTNRLSPMEVMGHATEAGLEEAAKKALAPHFHAEGTSSKTFAIRPSIRHHNKSDMNRDTVIQLVAGIVGKPHRVDLKAYELLILVEVYRNVCGVSVVGGDFEKLKRFNLAELTAPSKKPDANKAKDEAKANIEQQTEAKTSEQSAAKPVDEGEAAKVEVQDDLKPE